MPSLIFRFRRWLNGLLGDTAAHAAPAAGSTEAIDLSEHNVVYNMVPYDENLLERSRTQWQFGDWESLAAIARTALQHHPDRAKLALLKAAGHQGMGHASEARQYVRLALDWGCSKALVSQILISGVHNTLGRAAAAGGQEHKALKHFQASLQTGDANSDVRLLTQARAAQQFVQLGMTPNAAQVFAGQTWQSGQRLPLEAGAQPTKRIAFTLKTQIDLGLAWAANTVNTCVFRHHGILTSGRQQFAAFYADEQTLRLVQRDLDTDQVITHDIAGQYNLRDAHNSISLGLDREQHLHISYDHHATQLRYRRATHPRSIRDWSGELQMTGAHEERVTYPTFILPHHGYPLTLLYRDGTHNKGNARLKTYDEATQTWADHPTAILSGFDQKPWTSNAYWNHPVTGTDGTLHLSYVWRIQGMGDATAVANTNVGYACSPDNGKTWQTSLGHPYKLPITQVNSETVYPVAPGCNLMNQCSMALDSRNRPHIVFYADDAHGIPQYQHLHFDGKVWHHTMLSQRTADFELRGGGTLQTPISRPDIVLDAQDNAYVIYRGDLSCNRMAATLLPSPSYSYHPANTLALLDLDVGFAEPIIDRSRWKAQGILTLLLQPNDQPDHDIRHQVQQTAVTLADIQFH